ncbi:MAG: colanic acid biosynthesis acetyltransferase WcaF [Candidatus Electrothrix sp. ATG1]|nr:colanic acid biosynthesis acetyltransferase WcaF [Candidatus Electrothrix sp. ATG1]
MCLVVTTDQSSQSSQLSQQQYKVRLDRYDNRAFDRGAGKVKEALWLLVQALLITSWVPGSWHRVVLLRLFGARIAPGVVLRPRLRVKFPWRLMIGKHTWIGESCWIDNLAEVRIGAHCCLSQGTCLCTGNHDWSAEYFDFYARPIMLHDYVWTAAFSKIGPGVMVGEGAVLSFGSVAVRNLGPWKIYAGIPCSVVKARQVCPDVE